MNNVHHLKNDEQRTQKRLMDAGIALFAKKGYASTSVREIVARAKVTKPALYYYFNNKESMFISILNTASERQESMLADVLETPGTVLDRIIHLYRHIHEVMVDNTNLFRMIHNLILGPPQGAPQYDFDKFHRRMVEVIKAIYLEGLARGEVKEADPDDVAFLVLSLIDFGFHIEYVYPQASNGGRGERLLSMAFQGLMIAKEG